MPSPSRISPPARSWYARSTVDIVAISAPRTGSATASTAQRRENVTASRVGGGRSRDGAQQASGQADGRARRRRQPREQRQGDQRIRRERVLQGRRRVVDRLRPEEPQ